MAWVLGTRTTHTSTVSHVRVVDTSIHSLADSQARVVEPWRSHAVVGSHARVVDARIIHALIVSLARVLDVSDNPQADLIAGQGYGLVTYSR